MAGDRGEVDGRDDVEGGMLREAVGAQPAESAAVGREKDQGVGGLHALGRSSTGLGGAGHGVVAGELDQRGRSRGVSFAPGPTPVLSR